MKILHIDMPGNNASAIVFFVNPHSWENIHEENKKFYEYNEISVNFLFSWKYDGIFVWYHSKLLKIIRLKMH